MLELIEPYNPLCDALWSQWLHIDSVAAWLLENRGEDGAWDYGTQVKDPGGYFGYFSLTRDRVHNRRVDCTMEVLSVLNGCLDKNEKA